VKLMGFQGAWISVCERTTLSERATKSLSTPKGRRGGLAFGLINALHAIGVWLTALALAVQLGAAAAVPDIGAGAKDDTFTARLAASICHAGDPGSVPSPAKAPHHHAPACALCAVCRALATPGFLPASPGFSLAAPEFVRLRAARLPPARASPTILVAAFEARGPPASS
jgi:hypothetical protein